MRDKTYNCKEEYLHCGITGSAGSGKSSFINTIRNLKGQDTGAAAVGVTETMKESTPYQDPDYPNVVYWDLPGVGTKNFPMDETYLEKINFYKYNFFLITSCTRFTEKEVWLAKQIRDAGKRFFFIRTKLDDDLRNHRREYRDTYDEQNVRNKIYKDSVERLEKQGITDPKVFLVANPYPEIPDFPDLLIKLAKSLPLRTREAMILSIHSFSKKIILEKKKILEKRIYYLSGLSALCAAIPVPGLSIVADFSIIFNEIANYRKQFGLEDEDLEKYKITDDQIEFIRKFSTKKGIVQLVAIYAVSTITKEISRFIPVIGTFIASIASFYTTYSMLNLILNHMTDASIGFMEKRFNNIIKDIEWISYGHTHLKIH